MPDKTNSKPPKRLFPLGRKAKDKKEVAAMGSAMSQGKNYSFVKKSDKTMNVGMGKKASARGAVVTGKSEKKLTATMEKPEGSGNVLQFQRGKETKTYTPSRQFGGKGYGPENPDNKDAAFIEEARTKKQDIAYDKEGKPYRAGITTVKKEKDVITSSLPVGKPKLDYVKKQSIDVKEPVGSGMTGGGKRAGKRKIMPVDYLIGERGKGIQNYQKRTKKRELGY